jgi:hypothetical protein
MINKTSKGKESSYFTLTTITESAGLYIIATAYYIDSECTKYAKINPEIDYYQDQENALLKYNTRIKFLSGNLKKYLQVQKIINQ